MSSVDYLLVGVGSPFVYKPSILPAHMVGQSAGVSKPGPKAKAISAVTCSQELVQIAVVHMPKELNSVWPVIKICLVCCLHTQPRCSDSALW